MALVKHEDVFGFCPAILQNCKEIHITNVNPSTSLVGAQAGKAEQVRNSSELQKLLLWKSYSKLNSEILLTSQHKIICLQSFHVKTQKLRQITCSVCVGIWLSIKGRGRVINTPALHWGGPGFKSRPGDQLSWLSFFFLCFPESMWANGGTVPTSY
jgi:hypothetical protein